MNTEQMLRNLQSEPLAKDAIFKTDEPDYLYVARNADDTFTCTSTAPYDLRRHATIDDLRARLAQLRPADARWWQCPIMGMDEERTLRTTQQVAAQLGVNDSRVRQLAEARGVGIHLGRDWRFRPQDVDAMRERKNGRPPRAGRTQGRKG